MVYKPRVAGARSRANRSRLCGARASTWRTNRLRVCYWLYMIIMNDWSFEKIAPRIPFSSRSIAMNQFRDTLAWWSRKRPDDISCSAMPKHCTCICIYYNVLLWIYLYGWWGGGSRISPGTWQSLHNYLCRATIQFYVSISFPFFQYWIAISYRKISHSIFT